MAERRGREDAVTLLVATALIAVAAVLLVLALLAHRRALGETGPWVSSKTALARPVPGTLAFVNDRQTLSHGLLNLHAWFGFHEVTSQRSFADIAAIEWTFLLGENAYLVTHFDRLEGGGRRSLRLSTHPGHPSAWLDVSPEGAFLAKAPLAHEPIEPFRLTTARLEFGDDTVRLTLDGREVATANRPRPQNASIGFRGGVAVAAVDRVRVDPSEDDPFVDGFDSARAMGFGSSLAAALAIAVTLAIYGALRRRDSARRWPLGFHFLGAALPIAVAAAAVWTYVEWKSDRYPAESEERLRAEGDYRWGTLERTRRELRESESARDEMSPDGGTRRILLVGGSQSWGQGASRDEDVLSEALCRALREGAFGDERSVECRNAAAPGATVGSLRPVLEAEWLDPVPDAVVLNVGSNDMATGPSFATDVLAMVDAARRRGSRVLLAKEAHAKDAVPPNLRERHRDLERVAAKTGVALFDMQAHLDARADDGFLWWDMVHLTSFGQRLAGELLAGALAEPAASADRGVSAVADP